PQTARPGGGEWVLHTLLPAAYRRDTAEYVVGQARWSQRLLLRREGRRGRHGPDHVAAGRGGRGRAGFGSGPADARHGWARREDRPGDRRGSEPGRAPREH